MRNETQPSDTASWKRRFEARHLWDMQLAPAAHRGLVVSKQTGVSQLYAWDLERHSLTQLTNREEGVLDAMLSPDGHYVYYLHDDRGNEIGHYVRIPFAGGPIEDITPELPPYSSGSFLLSADSATGLFIASSREQHTLYVTDLKQGTLTAVHESTIFLWGAIPSYDGHVTVVATTERTGSPSYSLKALEVPSGRILAELYDGSPASIWPVAFAPLPHDHRLLAMSNRSGVMQPLIWDIATDERSDLQLQLPGELHPLRWSPDGHYLLLSHIHRAVQRLYLYSLSDHQLIRLAHPAGSIKTADFGPDNQVFALWQNETQPPQILALDDCTDTRAHVAIPAPDVPPGRPWRSIDVVSSDGQQVQAWLGLPEGVGPFPTILHIHGGPAECVGQSFIPELQAWLDHGFAMCSVNYRGSTTFGQAFETAIFGNPGVLEIDDIVAARRWLVEHGIAHPNQILLMGQSYGGYLTLLALGKHPALWAGGMVSAPITDWTIQYEEASGRMRSFQAAFLGGTPDEQPDRYRRSSPMTYVEQVAAPVLIMQGYQDTRTPARAVDTYIEKMRAANKEVEVHWFDAGHGGVRANTYREIERHALMVQFARRILGV